MIIVDQLTKKYGNFSAVDALSFEVPKGQVLGLLGPNGAGKSTTMKMLTAFLPPSAGSVSIAGSDVVAEHLKIKKNVGFLPEDPPLYDDMRVTEYLSFVAELKKVDKKNIRQNVKKVIEDCGLSDMQNRIIATLSKGYRQRVGIAQALVNNPDLVILDEPTIGLDPAQIIEIRKLIQSLGKERTVILSTHILPEVMVTCDRVIIINKGKLVADKMVSEIKENDLEREYLAIVAGEQV